MVCSECPDWYPRQPPRHALNALLSTFTTLHCAVSLNSYPVSLLLFVSIRSGLVMVIAPLNDIQWGLRANNRAWDEGYSLCPRCSTYLFKPIQLLFSSPYFLSSSLPSSHMPTLVLKPWNPSSLLTHCLNHTSTQCVTQPSSGTFATTSSSTKPNAPLKAPCLPTPKTSPPQPSQTTPAVSANNPLRPPSKP